MSIYSKMKREGAPYALPIVKVNAAIGVRALLRFFLGSNTHGDRVHQARGRAGAVGLLLADFWLGSFTDAADIGAVGPEDQ